MHFRVALFFSLLVAVADAQLAIYNPTFIGSVQSDIDLGSHSIVHGTFNGPSQLVQLDSAGKIPALDGSLLTQLSWSQIHGAPATLAGYGVTDPIVLSSGSYANPSWLSSLAWPKVTGTPTTLAGYGIADPVALTTGNNTFSGTNTHTGLENIVPISLSGTSGTGWYRILAFQGASRIPSSAAIYAIDSTDFSAISCFSAHVIPSQYGSQPSLALSDCRSFGSGPCVTQVRLSSDGSGNSYLDLYCTVAAGHAFVVYLRQDGWVTPSTPLAFNPSLTGLTSYTYAVPTSGTFFSDPLNAPQLTSAPPASATAPGTAGTITWDGSYLYVCTGPNAWKRAPLSAW